MRNTVYNLKVVFSSLVFLNFGCPFTVTACNNMSLKSWGGGGGGGYPPPPLNNVHSVQLYLLQQLQFTE